MARPLFNINQLSLRQAITPDRLQGRVNATMRFAMWSVTPFGAIVGGVAATAFGVREVLFVAGLGVLAATLPLALTRVGRLERQPDPHARLTPTPADALRTTSILRPKRSGRRR